MTPAAAAFVTPMSLQAVSGREVRTDLFDPAAEQGMGHIELARWATRVLLAPASADLLARMRAGMANDLLTTVLLATQAPVAIAPAMNQGMWLHAATQANIEALNALYQPLWIGPDAGAQACGDVGPGRMSEPADIVASLTRVHTAPRWLTGQRVVITAGPTREWLDPVRYISNASSGKMGYALAQVAAEAGAEVTLISGPVNLPVPVGVQQVRVQTALEMLQAVEQAVPEADVFIASAAVADYRMAEVAAQKLKKSVGLQGLMWTENPDIVATIAQSPQRPKVVVGFAAETEQVLQFAQDKLKRKHLDWIVANDVSQAGIGFGSDDNQVTVFARDGVRYDIDRAPKIQVAEALLKLFCAPPSQVG
jgi:phosphopantothenoylcysteine decarboxylase/phosphopantothenate--cysteine ligase